MLVVVAVVEHIVERLMGSLEFRLEGLDEVRLLAEQALGHPVVDFGEVCGPGDIEVFGVGEDGRVVSSQPENHFAEAGSEVDKV